MFPAIIPIIVLAAVFLLIVLRQTLKLKLRIWQIMLLGAVAVLVTGQITPQAAIASVNMDVILFLFGMFVIGQALEESGYLAHVAYYFFKRAKSTNVLLLAILLVMGFAAAVLMNDTLAIIGTPVVLLLARKYKISAKPMLLALCFAVTIGSAMSPIGNPQNLLIAINGGVGDPFVTFLRYLLLPTVINLFVAYFILRIFYRDHLSGRSIAHSQEPIRDRNLAILSKLALYIVLILIVAKIAVAAFGLGIDFGLTSIALVASLPVLVLSDRRLEILRKIDWQTLVFFAAMFVLMASVWETGFFQSLITQADITSLPMILGVSVILSQFISNVPLVALYLPMLLHAGAGVGQMMALAAGSTIAGNLSLLGAASNIIVVQKAERKGETITFFDFLKVGVPLVVINVLVYWLFLKA